MRNDAALPRCAATSAPARLQRSNAQWLRDAGNYEKRADLSAFFLVWEHRHSYLDIRNDAVARTQMFVCGACRSDALTVYAAVDPLFSSPSSIAVIDNVSIESGYSGFGI
ncbi:hypothetical protein [Xanthomonas sp. 3498]|uniref:hypothetical protein n=1 Tax=Xanthomonas sp. 3498 TaxID=2663863 RepID=UPI00160A4AE4|nr:hypothetical protein [Xanthomonas sp. 3498]MBB5878440.1 hypothetical protein [Xanthomonas sp. 3498]